MAMVELDGVQYLFYTGITGWDAHEDGSFWTNGTELLLATSTDGISWEADPGAPFPVHRAGGQGLVDIVGAEVVGSRIHIWVSDMYDGTSGVGFFVYEPGIEPF